MRVTEFEYKTGYNNEGLDKQINSWLGKNKEIIDIKYCANNFGSHALVMWKYKDEEK